MKRMKIPLDKMDNILRNNNLLWKIQMKGIKGMKCEERIQRDS